MSCNPPREPGLILARETPWRGALLSLSVAGSLLALATQMACGRNHVSDQRARLGVVSLHDVTTELVVALGATDQLVGASRLVDPSPMVRAAVSGVPEVGSLESMMALAPRLVVGLEVSRQEDPGLVAALEDAGVSVYLARPGSLEAVYAMAHDLGTHLGVPERAAKLTTELRARIEQSTVSRGTPTRVFVYDCCDPPFSAGGRGVLNQLITRAGGQNVFAEMDDDWASVSWEEVLGRRPEFVIVHSYDHDGQSDVSGKRAQLAKIPGLSSLPSAVIPLGCSLGGLRSAEGLERLRQALKDDS